MPPRKKKEKTDDLPQDEPKIIQEVSINDLFECLKEFDNKVLLERLKVLERSVSLLHKEQINTKNILKEMNQSLVSLNLAYEELINSLGVSSEEVIHNEVETSIVKEAEVATNKKSGKKWN